MARSGRHLGLTLTELAAGIAIAGIIIAGATAATIALSATVWPQQQGLKMKPRINALAHGIAAWWRYEHCGAGAKPVALPAALAHEPVAAVGPDDACAVRIGGVSGAVRPTDCVARHLPPGLRRLLPQLATAPAPEPAPDGWFDWEVVSRPLPPPPPAPRPPDWRWSKPHLRLLWTPPPHVRERTIELGAVLAEELGAYCDDDGDADTREECDGMPPAKAGGLGERFVWAAPLGAFVRYSDDAARRRRLTEWLALNAVDCDADRNGEMDAFCDGPKRDDLIDMAADHVIDANSDGCDDARPRAADDKNHPRLADRLRDNDWPCHPISLLDGNDGSPDGKLDFDVTEDFVVDADDYRAIGC